MACDKEPAGHPSRPDIKPLLSHGGPRFGNIVPGRGKLRRRPIANAPVDDEPLSDEDERAIDESLEWLRHNKGIPHEQVLAELKIEKREIGRFRKLR
jgi:hypothetical protein